MNIFRKLLFTSTVSSILVASAVTQADTSADIVQSALNSSDRPSADAADDARRMPLEVLAFAGIEEGMTILEIEAGAGYYTEIMSRAVGSNGSIIMQNPPAFDGFSGEAVQTRLANNRLSNVTFTRVNFDELEAASGSVDMVTWILGPHELWFEPGGQNLGEMEDVDYLLKKVYRSLNVPISRMESDTGFNMGRSAEITRDEVKNGSPIERTLSSNNFRVFEEEYGATIDILISDERVTDLFDVKVRYQAGHEVVEFPPIVKSAILLKVASLYDTREDANSRFLKQSNHLLNHYKNTHI